VAGEGEIETDRLLDRMAHEEQTRVIAQIGLEEAAKIAKAQLEAVNASGTAGESTEFLR